MNLSEKHIARSMFKNQIYQSDSQRFEDLFVSVFSNFGDFRPVKPQGRYGDRKNDGYEANTGTYYQVYGPEDLPSKEESAVSKLNEDFIGLCEYWEGNNFDVNSFYYVVNDKYKGYYPTLLKAVEHLNNSTDKTVGLMRSKHLEDKLFDCPDDVITSIIGFIPNPLDVRFDFTVMAEVVRYLGEMDRDFTRETRPRNPNFDLKIEFNNLSPGPSELMKAGQRCSYAIADYFELNSEFSKESIRQVFVDLYKDAIEFNKDEIDNREDLIFFYILEKASPNKSIPITNAVQILVSYYFEYCDIFEIPPSVQ